jgi:cytochrome P450
MMDLSLTHCDRGVAGTIRDRFNSKSPETEQKNEDPSATKDMLTSWMQHGLTQLECEAESLLALVAGSETTASVLRTSLLHLLASPPVYAKLKTVVRDTIRAGVSEPISLAQAQTIPYLRAVIFEGLRMRPGTTGLFSKVVPPEGDTACGVFIPGGTVVAMNISAVLRDEEVFGKDAELYRPERWMEAGEEKRTAMEHEVELMFGSGRWQCLGKPIAFMELYKTVFELLRRFELQIATPTRPWYSVNYAVWVEKDFMIKVGPADA